MCPKPCYNSCLWIEVPKAEVTSAGERLLAWSFKHFEHDAGRMNLLNFPMAESSVAKKLANRESSGATSSGIKQEVGSAPATPAEPMSASKTSGKRGIHWTSEMTELWTDAGLCSAKKQRTETETDEKMAGENVIDEPEAPQGPSRGASASFLFADWTKPNQIFSFRPS